MTIKSNEEVLSEFEGWRDKNGGWPSRNECAEWFLSIRKADMEALRGLAREMKKEAINVDFSLFELNSATDAYRRALSDLLQQLPDSK